MVSAKFTAELSAESFDNLFRDLVNLKKDFGKVNDKFLDISLDYLTDRAIVHLGETTGQGSYPLTDELVNAFSSYREPNLAILRNESAHAAFVEFGTGIVGGEVPHETAAELGWVYDMNMHGEKGWVYMGDDGNYHHTTGMEAHRYMYNAFMDYLYGGGKEECMQRAMEGIR